MSKSNKGSLNPSAAAPSPYTLGPSVARLAAAPRPGEVWVKLDGHAPAAARLLAGLNREELTQYQGREVLVVLEQGDPLKPIIVGLLGTPLDRLEELVTFERPDDSAEIAVDGGMEESLIIEAEREIVLKCGESSITLRKDGKIVIRGTDLLSRSAGPNRLKGTSVKIN